MFGKTASTSLALALAWAAPAWGGQVCETFGTAANAASTHPGKVTLTRVKTGGSLVSANLAAIPAGATIHHASLIALRGGKGLEDRQKQWLLPVLLYALAAGRDAPAPDAKPLAFEAPWYRSFDVTAAVRQAVGAKASEVRFLVKQFYRWRPETTELRVIWEGAAARLPKQVAGVKVLARGGNTFITFKEIDRLVEKDELTIGEYAAIRSKLAQAEKTRRVRYRILRHTRPITPANVAAAAVLAEVAPLSGANHDGGLGHFGRKKETQNRFVVDLAKGKVPWGTGLYVHTTAEAAGTFHYAVVAVINGRANLKDITAANAPPAGAAEKASPRPVPVLQLDAADGKGRFGGVRSGARVRLYVTWNAPPFTNLPNQPYNWSVTIDEKKLARPAPVGLYLHEWGGTHVRTTWGWPGGRTGILVAGNDYPPQTWWYGWHEALGTSRSWGSGKVHNYTERRVLAFLDWVATQWPVDPNRIYAQGGSMGGSGIYTFCLRNGGRFAMIRGNVGIANWTVRGHFTTALELCTGYLNWKTPASDAATVADRMNMAAWLRAHPAVETPFLAAGNGKDDGAIGWAQAVTFFKALQDTRRPHAVFWGMRGHGTPPPSLRIDDKRHQAFRLDQTLPAFTRCSLDDDMGTATPLKTPKDFKNRWDKIQKDRFDGDSEGGLNLHLRWETDEKAVVDTPQAWAMTFLLDKSCRAKECTADVTPRRCRKFKARAGQKFTWTVKAVADPDGAGGKIIQSGQAEADKHGLVTMRKVVIRKTGSQVRLTAAK